MKIFLRIQHGVHIVKFFIGKQSYFSQKFITYVAIYVMMHYLILNKYTFKTLKLNAQYVNYTKEKLLKFSTVS